MSSFVKIASTLVLSGLAGFAATGCAAQSDVDDESVNEAAQADEQFTGGDPVDPNATFNPNPGPVDSGFGKKAPPQQIDFGKAPPQQMPPTQFAPPSQFSKAPPSQGGGFATPVYNAPTMIGATVPGAVLPSTLSTLPIGGGALPYAGIGGSYLGGLGLGGVGGLGLAGLGGCAGLGGLGVGGLGLGGFGGCAGLGGFGGCAGLGLGLGGCGLGGFGGFGGCGGCF